ncbi:MAG: hypothetical protein Q9212_005393 [Teloschistes hypoglaucus]
MHFTTLFQLTALAALLDPILAQLWNISAYGTDACAQTSLFFEEIQMFANLDSNCYSFGTMAKSAQVSSDIFKRVVNPKYEISTRIAMTPSFVAHFQVHPFPISLHCLTHAIIRCLTQME